jgi:hypothetical protein
MRGGGYGAPTVSGAGSAIEPFSVGERCHLARHPIPTSPTPARSDGTIASAAVVYARRPAATPIELRQRDGTHRPDRQSEPVTLDVPGRRQVAFTTSPGRTARSRAHERPSDQSRRPDEPAQTQHAGGILGSYPVGVGDNPVRSRRRHPRQRDLTGPHFRA